MDLQLRDRVVVITGGMSGIGRACVEAFVAEGAKVAVIDRAVTSPESNGVPMPQGETVHFLPADLSCPSEVRSAVDRILEHYGAVDVLVACAGVSGPVGTRFVDVEIEEWDAVMTVNVRGNFLVTKHLIPPLERSDVGAAIYLASDSSFIAYPGMAPYSVSKGAVVMLAKSLTADHPKIRANALCPGVVDTPMSRADLGMTGNFSDRGISAIPAAQIAAQVLFLASPLSASINATTIVSDLGAMSSPSEGPIEFAP